MIRSSTIALLSALTLVSAVHADIGGRPGKVAQPKHAPVRRTADINRDGIVNLFDLLAFQTAMGQGSLVADYAPQWGTLDVFDWLAFNKIYTEQYGQVVR